ncbi:MAG: malto-oligosyltrehalose trehalohydrolase [Candidatus Baltobacteraceae bacterium]
MPFGAEVRPDGVRFALWAPGARSVSLELDADSLQLRPRGEGWFELATSAARAGTRYTFAIDGAIRVADPASRFQPEGVRGSSEVVDPRDFSWSDAAWSRPPWEALVFYELHVGTFSPLGSYAGVCERLDDLVRLGVTALVLMPLAEFPGAWNWGYDGVFAFAPSSRYGRPDELKALVCAAHARGLAVFVDVVYNHFGPEGNYLARYAPQFFSTRYQTPWGAGLDFIVPEVRTFFIENALYWLEEYHFDGLRLDAIHAINDPSEPSFPQELATALSSRGHCAADGRAYAIVENENNETGPLRAFSAQLNDDVHHAFHVLLTGERDGYYVDYAERPIENLARALSEGFAYQGEPSAHRSGRARGEPSRSLALTSFVIFLQNHDQIGNRALGDRLSALASPPAIRAAAAILLLAPSLPLLFAGEEWAATTPFPFFCDFEPGLADLVRAGRLREFGAFPRFASPEARAAIPDATLPDTFGAARLRWEERDEPASRTMLAHYSSLLRLRAREIVPIIAGTSGGEARARVVGERALELFFALRSGVSLELRANLSERKQSGFSPVSGTPLFVSDAMAGVALARGALPPWSVAWHRTP